MADREIDMSEKLVPECIYKVKRNISTRLFFKAFISERDYCEKHLMFLTENTCVGCPQYTMIF